MKMVLVTWLDSGGDSGWRRFDEAVAGAATRRMHCTTIGYLVEQEADDRVVVAQSLAWETGGSVPTQAESLMCIPRVAVVSIVELVVP